MSIRILTILLCLLDGLLCFSQSSTQHIVQRGETFEIVAQRYGMTIDELRQANPWIGGCYAGLKLDIPTGKKQKMLTSSEALVKAYLERGKSNFENGDYKDAIRDLEMAIGSDNCTPSMKKECEDLLASARSQREAQIEKRNGFWGGIAAALVTTAAVAASSAMASSVSTPSSAYSPEIEGWPDRDKSLDYLLDPNYTIMQMNIEDHNDYQMFKLQTGMDMSFEEFRAMKYQAIYETEHGGGSNLNEPNGENEYRGELSPAQYQENYNRWESSVQSYFNNLTPERVRYQDSNGNIKGKTVDQMSTVGYMGNKAGLRRAQDEMRKIRMEAARYGVTIQQSKWETATAGY